MLGRYDSWRLACFLAKQNPKEPRIYAELEARGISADGIGEMLALAMVNGFGWAWIVLGDSRGAQRISTALAAAAGIPLAPTAPRPKRSPPVSLRDTAVTLAASGRRSACT